MSRLKIAFHMLNARLVEVRKITDFLSCQKSHTILRLFFVVSALGLSGCKSLQESSQTLSTDERPDISEDRSQVKFTAGTKDYSILRASDVKISFNFRDKNSAGELRDLTGRRIRYVHQHPLDQRFAVAVEFSEADAKAISMVLVGHPSDLDRVSTVGYYLNESQMQSSAKKLRAMHEITNLFFDAKNQLHVIQADDSGNSSELIFSPTNEFKSCQNLKSKTSKVSLCDTDPI